MRLFQRMPRRGQRLDPIRLIRPETPPPALGRDPVLASLRLSGTAPHRPPPTYPFAGVFTFFHIHTPQVPAGTPWPSVSDEETRLRSTITGFEARARSLTRRPFCQNTPSLLDDLICHRLAATKRHLFSSRLWTTPFHGSPGTLPVRGLSRPVFAKLLQMVEDIGVSSHGGAPWLGRTWSHREGKLSSLDVIPGPLRAVGGFSRSSNGLDDMIPSNFFILMAGVPVGHGLVVVVFLYLIILPPLLLHTGFIHPFPSTYFRQEEEISIM